MDVWEPLNPACAPGGEFAKPMEERGAASTALNTGTSLFLPFPGTAKPQLPGHSSICSRVAVLGSQPSPGSVSHHGLLPCPGEGSVGSIKGSRAGRKGSITVTNNCVLTN